jgi:transcriptional regulator with XRE-family HTH domain
MFLTDTGDTRHNVQRCQQVFSEFLDSTPDQLVLSLDTPSAMPYKALSQLRMNVEFLLTIRKEKKQDLAAEMKLDPSTLTKFLNGTREIQFHHLDGMATFFGLEIYQLFQPGISPLGERRHIKDRRQGGDRRKADRLAHVPTPHPARRVANADRRS